MGTKLTTSERKEIADAIEDYIGLYVSGGDINDNGFIYTRLSHCCMTAEITIPNRHRARGTIPSIQVLTNNTQRSLILNWTRLSAVQNLFYHDNECLGNQVGIKICSDTTIIMAFNAGFLRPNRIMANYTFCNYDQKSFAQIIPTVIGLLDKYVLPSRPVLALRRLRHWFIYNTVLAEN